MSEDKAANQLNEYSEKHKVELVYLIDKLQIGNSTSIMILSLV